MTSVATAHGSWIVWTVGLIVARLLAVDPVEAAEVQAEAGLGVAADSNVHREKEDVDGAVGPSTYGRLRLRHGTPNLEIEGRGGLAVAVLAPGSWLVPAELFGAGRLELGPRDRFSVTLEIVGGARHLLTPRHDQPEGAVADLVELPDLEEAAGTARFIEARARVAARVQGQPTDGLFIRGFGGAWFRHAWLTRAEASGGVEVRGRVAPAPVVHLTGRVVAALDSERVDPINSIRDFGGPAEPYWAGRSLRIGGVGGASFGALPRIRVDVELGWVAVRASWSLAGSSLGPTVRVLPGPVPPDIRWTLGPEGLVGRVRVRFGGERGDPAIDVGIGRTINAVTVWGAGTPTGRTTAWVAIEGDVAGRLRAFGEFEWSFLDDLGRGATTHIWTTGATVEIRLAGPLSLRLDGRFSAQGPSLGGPDEYLAVTGWAGLSLRPVGQGSLGLRAVRAAIPIPGAAGRW